MQSVVNTGKEQGFENLSVYSKKKYGGLVYKNTKNTNKKH